MKKIIIITSLLVIALSGNLMAKTGFEVNVLIPFGVSLGTYTGTDASKYTKADAGFEFGIHVIPGYYFGISNIGLGIGFDIGYQKDVFAFGLKSQSGRKVNSAKLKNTTNWYLLQSYVIIFVYFNKLDKSLIFNYSKKYNKY